jgi:uncharacterized protein involved in response to NO
MAVVGITTNKPVTGPNPFALGFRPMFLLAGLSGMLLMALWLLQLAGTLPPPAHYPGHYWHSHEMLFGYTAAVIVGFLLTASRNWTGVPTLHGPWLAGLGLLWLAGRILPFLDSFSGLAVAVVDLAFLLLAGIAIGYPVVKTRQVKNLLFTPIVLGLWTANLLMQLQFLDIAGTAETGSRLGTGLIALLMVVMGTRVIPFFIERGTGGKVLQSKPLDITGNLFVAAWLIVWVLQGDSPVSGVLAAIAALLLLIRWAGWHNAGLWRVSLLWVLYLGFLFIPVGLAMRLGVTLGWMLSSGATHAVTAGAIGSLTIGMMARVALGHTGRPLTHNRLILGSFLLIVPAGLFRLLASTPLYAEHYLFLVTLSGGLWAGAFLLFVINYLPVLIMARVDGRPG